MTPSNPLMMLSNMINLYLLAVHFFCVDHFFPQMTFIFDLFHISLMRSCVHYLIQRWRPMNLGPMYTMMWVVIQLYYNIFRPPWSITTSNIFGCFH